MEKSYSEQIDEELKKIKEKKPNAMSTSDTLDFSYQEASLFLQKKQTLLLFDIAHYLKQIAELKVSLD